MGLFNDMQRHSPLAQDYLKEHNDFSHKKIARSSWCDYKISSINYAITSIAKYHLWWVLFGLFLFLSSEFLGGIGLGFF